MGKAAVGLSPLTVTDAGVGAPVIAVVHCAALLLFGPKTCQLMLLSARLWSVASIVPAALDAHAVAGRNPALQTEAQYASA